MYRTFNYHLHLFAEIKLHHFLSGLKLFQHIIVRRVLLMRRTQPIRLLPQDSSIPTLPDLQLVVEILLLQLLYNVLEVLPVPLYLPNLYLKVLYRLLLLFLVRQVLCQLFSQLFYTILLPFYDLLKLLNQ